jgi:small subunit ribosomal protein S14
MTAISKTDTAARVEMASARHFAKMEKKPKFQVRYRNRCRVCGRSRAFYRKFELCRICLRNLALRGEVPGVTKSSW